TAPHGLAQTRQSEGSGATCRHRDQRIVGIDLMMACELGSSAGLVLGALHGPDHGRFAPRDQQQKPLARPAECGHQFRAVLNGKTACGSRSRVDQAALVLEPLFQAEGGALDFGQGRSYRSYGGKLTANHGLQNVPWIPTIDVRVAWAWTFCFHEHGSSLSKNALHPL